MRPPATRLVVAVAIGGATGAALRGVLGGLAPEADGALWITFAINVVGAFALAALPALRAVRRSPTLTAGLGAGVLGGFTTLSATSEQARYLLDTGRTGTAAVYLVGTLAAAVVAVAVASRVVGRLTEADPADAGEGG